MRDDRVRLRFFRPSDALIPYVSTLYLTVTETAPGRRMVDYLHPEWANLRLVSGEPALAAIGNAAPGPTPHLVATGPTSRACYFAAGTMRAWGIGLLPLGWARFVGAPAHQYADRFVDAASDPVFARLAGLHEALGRAEEPDDEAEAAIIDGFLAGLLAETPHDDPRIVKAHRALVDEAVTSVAAFGDRLGMTERSLERFCRRVFGFPPKLLLRRQRFIRSLAKFMMDPSLHWVSAIDPNYHDQAHFRRDFLRFMGMNAGAFAAMPHPIMLAAAQGRMALAGQAMQALHLPSEADAQ